MVFGSKMKYLTAALLLSALSTQSSAEIGGKETELDTIFSDYVANTTATSATVEIRERMGNGEFVTRYRKSYGTLSNNAYSRVTPLNVLMRQASVAKTVTVVAANQLINANRLARNSKVFCALNQTPRAGTIVNSNCIIPFGGAFNDSRYYQIDVGHLMDHKSGINQTLLSIGNVFSGSYTPVIEDFIEEMRSTSLLTNPGVTEAYSNLGYDLLAHVIGKASPPAQGNFIAYARSIGASIGICNSDLILDHPLFLGAVPGREPEYYSFDSWQAPNLFRHPVNNTPLGTLTTAENGGGTYGYLPGGGGISMTTRAMLRFAQYYQVYTGLPRDNGILIRAGGGPGTFAILGQNIAGKYDVAFIINANETASLQDALADGVFEIVEDIPATPPSQYAAAVAASSAYDIPCDPTFSTTEEPNLYVAQNAWNYYTVTNANKVTLYNISANVDLYVRNGTSNPTTTTWNCRPLASGVTHESCALDSANTYRIGVRGTNAGRYMLDINHSYQAEETASFSAGSVITNHDAGYTGTGIVDTPDAIGTWVGFAVRVPAAGTYGISLRHANGSGSSRPMNVSVNGTVVGQISGLSQGWTTWQTTLIPNVSLNAGVNTIRFIATSNGGNPNLDKLDIK